MANDLEKTLEGLPGWVVPAIAIGVVLLALMANKNKSSGGYSEVTAYTPIPADQGILAFETAKVNARAHLLESFASDLTQSDIFSMGSKRDIGLATINADVANTRTAAQERAAYAAEQTRQIVGKYATDAQVATATARARADVDVANSQGATAKYVAKKSNNPLNTLIKSAGSAIAHIFGK